MPSVVVLIIDNDNRSAMWVARQVAGTTDFFTLLM